MTDRRFDFSLQKDTLHCDSGPYVHRWIVETPWGSLRLHHWVGNDDQRALHDHPWAFYTLVLKGGYLDKTEGLRIEEMKPGRLRYRPARHTHTVLLTTKDCWTLVLTGPKVRNFGFLVGHNWLNARKYFEKYGKAPCS